MKRSVCFAVLLISCFAGLAQVKISGTVRDSITSERIPFVHVRVLGSGQVTMTDNEGQFSITASRNDQLKFSYVGYGSRNVQVSTFNDVRHVTVFLARTKIGVDEVEVFAGENPAHRIIRQAVRNRSSNDPESLDQFTYTAYEKFIVSAYRQKDSGVVIQDSIASDELTTIEDSTSYAAPPDTTDLPEDSTRMWPDSIDPLDSTNLFLMETVTQRYFAGTEKDKSKVIASRVSGFKRMDYLVLASQMQPVGFYHDRVYMFGVHYLNPISKGSTSQYFFHLRDTIFQGQDSIFVISFHPFKQKNFKGLRGVLYINSDGYALQNIVTEPNEQGGTLIRIQQQYDKFGEKWFPVVLKMDVILSSIVINNSKGWISSRRMIEDIKTNVEIERKNLRGFDVEVSNNAYNQPDSVWAAYRHGGLTRKEINTYKIIDSLGQEENLDQIMRWVKALATGKVRTGKIDWKLRELFEFNRYEVFRLGAGLETNENLLEPLRFGGHVAYGFGDHFWKYGIYGKWIIDRVRDLTFAVGYNNDVFHAAGRPKFYNFRWPTIWEGDLYRVYINDMYHRESIEGTLTFRLWPDLTGKLSGGQARYWQPLNEYQLSVANDQQVQVVRDQFVSNYAGLQLRYAYGEKHIRLLNEVISLGSDYPVFYLNYLHSFENLGSSTLGYKKLEFLAAHDFLFRKLGRTNLTLSAGWTDAKTPYYLQYFMPGANEKNNFTAFSNSFQTMSFQQFLADGYAMLNIDHNFGNVLGKNRYMEPSLHLEVATGFGWNRTPEIHEQIDFTAFNGGYHEVGLSLRDLLLLRTSNQFGLGLGGGCYYRLGPYHSGVFKEDFAVKFTLNFRRPDF